MPISRAPTGHRIGESHPLSKLTAEDVRRIRALRKQGKGYKRIARETGHPRETVRSVLDGRTWAHLEDGCEGDGSGGTLAS